jgi:hypothetical protein
MLADHFFYGSPVDGWHCYSWQLGLFFRSEAISKAVLFRPTRGFVPLARKAKIAF